MSPAVSWLLVTLWIGLWWLLITRYDRRDYSLEVPADVQYVDRLAHDLAVDEDAVRTLPEVEAR